MACCALTTWRATRLVTTDTFPPVKWVRDRIGPEWLSDLVTCHWCASPYLAALVVGLTDLFISVPAPLLVFGASAAIGAGLAEIEDRTG